MERGNVVEKGLRTHLDLGDDEIRHEDLRILADIGPQLEDDLEKGKASFSLNILCFIEKKWGEWNRSSSFWCKGACLHP